MVESPQQNWHEDGEKGWRLKRERVKRITWWRGYGIWRFDGVAWLLWPKWAKYQNLEPSKLIVDVYYWDPPQPSSLAFCQQTPLHHNYWTRLTKFTNFQFFTTFTLLTTFLYTHHNSQGVNHKFLSLSLSPFQILTVQHSFFRGLIILFLECVFS